MTRVLIQAVPWDQRRVRVVRDLLTQVPDAEVVWDSERSGYRTFKLVMEAMGDGPGILLEDDVELCSDWRNRVEAVVEANPDDVITFFDTIPHPDGVHRLHPRHFGGNLCVYFPAGTPADFLSWVEEGTQVTDHDEQYHDLLFGRYLRKRGLTYLSHVPSLVQHRPFASVVNPNRSKKRQSPTYWREVGHA